MIKIANNRTSRQFTPHLYSYFLGNHCMIAVWLLTNITNFTNAFTN
nr:MAG TPA: hypothetical protein [Caudoviricetes sp.]